MSTSISDDILMHKREAEWHFAFCTLANSDRARKECGWLKPEQIQDADIRRYWKLLLEGSDGSKAAVDCGIMYRLMSYDQKVFSTFNDLTVYAATIMDDEYLFQVSNKVGRMAGLISERDIPTIRGQIAEIGTLSPNSDLKIPTSTDVACKFLTTLSEDPSTMIFGIPVFDRKFGGMLKKTLTILAARPSMGKSALALQAARVNAAIGKKVIYFSAEMASEYLWARMALGATGIPAIKYKTRCLTEDEKEQLSVATGNLVDELSDHLFIEDKSNPTSADIWQACSRIQPDLVIVDHLAKVADLGDNEVHRLGKVTSMGKAMAKEFNVASLYLCQLSRGVTMRENKEPAMSDLRDSGEIEQDADAVIFIHRPDYYDTNGIELGVSPTKLLIGKDRDGIRNGKVACQYNLSKQYFYGESK